MKRTATQFKMPGIANALNISSRRSFDTEPWAAFYCRLSQDDECSFWYKGRLL